MEIGPQTHGESLARPPSASLDGRTLVGASLKVGESTDIEMSVRVLGGVAGHTMTPEGAGKPPVQKIDRTMDGTRALKMIFHLVLFSNLYFHFVATAS